MTPAQTTQAAERARAVLRGDRLSAEALAAALRVLAELEQLGRGVSRK